MIADALMTMHASKEGGHFLLSWKGKETLQ